MFKARNSLIQIFQLSTADSRAARSIEIMEWAATDFSNSIIAIKEVH